MGRSVSGDYAVGGCRRRSDAASLQGASGAAPLGASAPMCVGETRRGVAGTFEATRASLLHCDGASQLRRKRHA